MKSWLKFVVLLSFTALVVGGCSENPIAKTGPPTIRVPADEATIQAAINVAGKAGFVVLVSDGIYTGPGNRDLDFHGKQIILQSVNGPASTIIDCQGSASEPHFGIQFMDKENNAIVDGFTIRGGYFNSGAAISFSSASPTIKNCIFTGNHAAISGGAVRCKNSSPTFINCTFTNNSSANGGGLFLVVHSSPLLENCIIANSEFGESVRIAEGTSRPTLVCCNLYGNIGGDWVGKLSEQSDISGNLNIDPLFCNSGGDFNLQADSPCAAQNNSCGVLIGALPVKCN